MLSVTLTAEEWSTVVAMLELTDQPWPEALARADLAYLRAEAAHGFRGRAPGRDVLARRWGWTPYDVRALLERLNRADTRTSPEPRQPESAPTRTAADQSVISDQVFASGTPEPRQNLASDPEPRDQPSTGSRDVRQNLARFDTEQAGQSAGFRQNLASLTPARLPTFPPHTPPSDLPLDPDQKTDQEGGSRGEGASAPASPADLAGAPQLQGRLFRVPDPAERAAAIPEAQAFLQVWTRWRNASNAPHRWAGGPAEALGWFLEQLGMPPDTEIGRAISRLDVVGALQAWDAWLSDRADEHGRPGTAARSKFPHNWKRALRNWLINQVKFGRNLKAAATGPGSRRGAWAGQATRFAPSGAAAAPAPADHGETPCTNPGDYDALERF